MSTNLIVGTGKFGKRFYHHLINNGQTVTTLSRSEKAWSKNHIQKDLLEQELTLPKINDLSRVFIILAPAERNEVSYRKTYIEAVTNLLQSLYKENSEFHCTFLSATSVFGSKQLGVIDENVDPQPDNFRGRILLEAEKNIISLCNSYSIVRASGLYSSARSKLIESVLSKEKTTESKWLNLIHEDDLCSWLDFASSQKSPLSIASDGSPFQRQEVQLNTRSQKDQNYRQFKSEYLAKISLKHPSFIDWLNCQ